MRSVRHNGADRMAYPAGMGERRGPAGERAGGTVPVAFLGGLGRSGSTLLSRALGATPGLVSVGELCFLWVKGLQRDRGCGCGHPFSECEFWQRVGKEAFGGWDRIDAAEVVALRRAVERVRSVPLLAAPRLAPSFAAKVRRYGEFLEPVYRAAATVAGAETVVDMSKYPSNGYLLRALDGVDLRLVHLVRAAQGVAYSWTKTAVARPDHDGKPMPVYPPVRTALDWDVHNALFDGLRVLGVPSLLVRYEDLVAAPAAELGRILTFLGRPAADADAVFGSGPVDLPVDHTIGGNPGRFRVGPQNLRVDDEWRRSMPAKDRRTVSALAAPMLLRYGYLRRPSR